MTRRKFKTDPLTRPCSACNAGRGDACRLVEIDGRPLTLVPYATRLVHAVRLEGPTHA